MSKSLATKFISAGIITAALGLGAGFGHLTSPDNPAHASTTDDNGGCSLVCVHHGAGSGGIQPGLLGNGSARVGNVSPAHR